MFDHVGITPPKECLSYDPPGTDKTLLARAVAEQIESNFLKMISSAIVDKYIGESARLIREMLNFTRFSIVSFLFIKFMQSKDQDSVKEHQLTKKNADGTIQSDG